MFSIHKHWKFQQASLTSGSGRHPTKRPKGHINYAFMLWKQVTGSLCSRTFQQSIYGHKTLLNEKKRWIKFTGKLEKNWVNISKLPLLPVYTAISCTFFLLPDQNRVSGHKVIVPTNFLFYKKILSQWLLCNFQIGTWVTSLLLQFLRGRFKYLYGCRSTSVICKSVLSHRPITASRSWLLPFECDLKFRINHLMSAAHSESIQTHLCA